MNRRRLRKLAKFLKESVPKKRFKMSAWGDEGFAKNKCSTSACALGWATLCFPRSGLTMRYHGGDLEIKYQGRRGTGAAGLFFGLSSDRACSIFLGPDCTPKQKAKQIERLLLEPGS